MEFWRIMTEAQKKMWIEFDTKVRLLMFMYNDLKQEKAELLKQMSEKEQQMESTLQELKLLKTKYDNLLTARVVVAKAGDSKNAKQQLSKLVREVEKCIALLNE